MFTSLEQVYIYLVLLLYTNCKSQLANGTETTVNELWVYITTECSKANKMLCVTVLFTTSHRAHICQICHRKQKQCSRTHIIRLLLCFSKQNSKR